MLHPVFAIGVNVAARSVRENGDIYHLTLQPDSPMPSILCGHRSVHHVGKLLPVWSGSILHPLTTCK